MHQDDRFMTDTRTPFERFVEKRKVGLSAVVLFFVAQLLYGHFYCSAGAMSFLTISAIVMFPGIVCFINWRTNNALSVFTGIILPFCLWANYAECSPSTGGGAAMAYVVVMLFGWPIAILFGVAVASAMDKDEKLELQQQAEKPAEASEPRSQ
jgi:hypothetical protein